MSDEAAVKNVLEDFLKPFEDDDVDGLLDYYADDMIWMLPNSPVDASKVEARNFYKSAFMRGVFSENNVEIHELKVLGDWAFVRFTASGRFTQHGEQSGPIRGSRHLMLLRKQQDGSWKISRDIFNNPDTAG